MNYCGLPSDRARSGHTLQLIHNPGKPHAERPTSASGRVVLAWPGHRLAARPVIRPHGPPVVMHGVAPELPEQRGPELILQFYSKMIRLPLRTAIYRKAGTWS